MDPYQTYLDMYDAMKTKDHDAAREHALNLKEWFAKGGYCPYQLTPIAMQAYLSSVLWRTRYLEYLTDAED